MYRDPGTDPEYCNGLSDPPIACAGCDRPIPDPGADAAPHESLCGPCAAAAHLYHVRAVRFEPTHTEELRPYTAASLGEALTMAERADAGRADYVYGIRPEDYARAEAEGITFNEADGLLVDAADARCRSCGGHPCAAWCDVQEYGAAS